MAFEFAGTYGPEPLLAATTSKLLPNTTVTIYQTGTTTPVVLYSDRTMAEAVANPTVTDARGNLTFFCAPGPVDIVANGVTLSGVMVPVDPADVTAVVSADMPIAGGVFTGSVGWQLGSGTTVAEQVKLSGDVAPRFVRLANGQMQITSGAMPISWGSHTTGTVGNGSDFLIGIERAIDVARTMTISEPRFRLTDGTNYFHLSAAAYSGSTLDTTFDLVCDVGSFGALAASGTLNFTSVGYGNGTITYTAVAIPGTDGPGTSSTITVSGSTGISSTATDGSARYMVNTGDSFGAKIWRVANFGGEEVNDFMTFRYSGVGLTSAYDIQLGYIGTSRSGGSAVFYGTDLNGSTGETYVYTYRTISGSAHEYVVFCDNSTTSFSSTAFWPSTGVNLGTSLASWGTGFIGTVLVGSGTVAAPTVAFQSETGTGIYRASAGVIGVAVAGAQVANVDAGGVTMSVAGTAAGPSLALLGGATGFWSPTVAGANAMGVAVGGVSVLALTHNISTGALAVYPATDDAVTLGLTAQRFSAVYSYLFAAEAGTTTAPAVTFRSDLTSGLASGGTGVLDIVAGGALIAQATSTGITMNGLGIHGGVPGTASTDFVTVSQLTALSAGLSLKGPAQEATAAALPANTYAAGVITITATGVLTVDGVTVNINDVVLVKNEATAANNGLYLCTTAGAAGVSAVLTRTSNMTTAAQVPGAFVIVETGTANTGTGWVVANEGPFTIGTTAINWTQFGSGSGGPTLPLSIANGGLGAGNITTKATSALPYTTLYTDQTVILTGSTAGTTLTLGTTSFVAGQRQLIINESATAVTLAAASGSINIVSLPSGAGMEMIFDGTNWKGAAGYYVYGDTSNVASFSTPAFVSGTALQISTGADKMLYITCTTSASLTVTMGPTTGAENSIVPAVVAPVGGYYSMLVPKTYRVIVTGTVADFHFVAQTV
jgi:hypothetical protein